MTSRRQLLLLLSLGVSVLLLVAPQASARRGPAVSLVGYRVIVEPEIAEAPGGTLTTRALVWKLRAVYTDDTGRTILVSPKRVRGKRTPPREATVVVDRPFSPEDYSRHSADFVHLDQAWRHFEKASRSSDITLLDLPVVAGHAAPPRGLPPARPLPPVVVVEPPAPPAAPAPKAPTCEQVLLDKGHHPSHLKRCQGVVTSCATALLTKGHHPQHLDRCKAVEPACAGSLLRAGHHPMHLDECTIDLSPGCAERLLANGHHPQHLDSCSRVDDACAQALLDGGRHPMHLDECRR